MMIFIEYFILVCLFVGFFFLNKKQKINKILLLILLNAVSTDFLAIRLQNINILYSISFIIKHSLWLIILMNIMKNNEVAKVFLSIFLTFAITNFLFIEKFELNVYTFIIGSFLYLILFIIESYRRLQQDDFEFIQSKLYIIIFAPVIFFLGFSFMLSFKTKELFDVIIYANICLYDFVITSVNLIYYALLLVYIYLDFKIKNEY